MMSDASHASSNDSRFEAHRTALFQRALRLTGCTATAEDVVQDCYLRWQAQQGKAAPTHLRAWLITVATRRVFELARCKQLPTTMLQSEHEVTSAAEMPRGDWVMLRGDMLKALSELTDMQRDVLLAKVLEEAAFREIAAQLDIAIPTVKTHYLRALRQMRDKLGARWSTFYED